MAWRVAPVLLTVAAVLGGCCHVNPPKQGAASALQAVPQTPPLEPLDRLYPGYAVMLVVPADPPRVPSQIEFRGLVQEDCTVTLLSNQVFTVTGRTKAEFQQEVHNHYVPRFFKNVIVGQTDPPIYIVRGEVWSPGLRVLFRPTTVLGAIELAGGFTSRANKKRVEVWRFNRTDSPYTSYDSTNVIDCVKTQRDRAADMEVQRDDVITVPRSFWKYWFPLGRDRSTNGSSQ